MKTLWLAWTLVVIGATAPSLPDVDGRFVVARVNGDPIFLDQVVAALESAHEDRLEQAEKVEHGDTSVILDRLIDLRLIVQETRAIGLDELPEFTKTVAARRTLKLRNELFADVRNEIPEPDPKRVEEASRNVLGEARLRALFIDAEADAQAIEKALADGRGFDDLADELVSDGRVTENDPQRWTPLEVLFPSVRERLPAMENGQVSPVLADGEAWVVFRLLEQRIRDDPERRQEIERAVLAEQRRETVRRRAAALKERYVRIDQEVRDSLDFGLEGPGLDAYIEDQRVLAHLDGGEPVTVAELARVVRGQFFHGSKSAAEKGLLEAKVDKELSQILDKRVVVLEAERLGLHEAREFRASMSELEDGLLFGSFLSRVIEPDLVLTEDELRAHLEEHIEEYTYPAMIRLESLAFEESDGARSALEKLRRGADPDWVRENANGLVPSDDETLLRFPNRPVMMSVLPESVRQAIADAEAGEYRFLEQPDGPYHVLYVRELVPERAQSYEEGRTDLARKVFAQKRQAALEAYAAQLREASEIETYAEGDALNQAILGLLGALE